jgi:hypothetical protein
MKQPKQGDLLSQHEDSSDLIIRDDEISKAPVFLLNAIELLFLEFRHYLNQDGWSACARTVVPLIGPSEQQAIKKQLMALYLSESNGKAPNNKECENFAEAWIHAVDARRAVAKGLEDAAQAHLDCCYTLLAANIKSQMHREMLENKAEARKECIDEFAKLVRAARPVGGWKNHEALVEALGVTLAIIIDKKKQEYGSFFKKPPATLINEWLAKMKGPVYEAYRGRKS